MNDKIFSLGANYLVSIFNPCPGCGDYTLEFRKHPETYETSYYCRSCGNWDTGDLVAALGEIEGISCPKCNCNEPVWYSYPIVRVRWSKPVTFGLQDNLKVIVARRVTILEEV